MNRKTINLFVLEIGRQIETANHVTANQSGHLVQIALLSRGSDNVQPGDGHLTPEASAVLIVVVVDSGDVVETLDVLRKREKTRVV